MTVATNPSPPAPTVERLTGDRRTIHRGRTWEQFKLIQQGFEHSPGMRLSYYKGTIEILMPGTPHELFKTIIGCLIELFLIDREIEFTPTGSATQEKTGILALEPDESYRIGDDRLAVEITFTSGDQSKLEQYQILGVHEVWFWQDGVLALYHLGADGYDRVEQSQIPALAAIDMTAMAQCILIGETSIVAASKAFRAAHPA
jgi:Uma2 family endonuclease